MVEFNFMTVSDMANRNDAIKLYVLYDNFKDCSFDKKVLQEFFDTQADTPFLKLLNIAFQQKDEKTFHSDWLWPMVIKLSSLYLIKEILFSPEDEHHQHISGI